MKIGRSDIRSEVIRMFIYRCRSFRFYDRSSESVFRRNIYHRRINTVKMQINIAVDATPGWTALKSIRGDGYCTWLSGHLSITDD